MFFTILQLGFLDNTALKLCVNVIFRNCRYLPYLPRSGLPFTFKPQSVNLRNSCIERSLKQTTSKCAVSWIWIWQNNSMDTHKKNRGLSFDLWSINNLYLSFNLQIFRSSNAEQKQTTQTLIKPNLLNTFVHFRVSSLKLHQSWSKAGA